MAVRGPKTRRSRRAYGSGAVRAGPSAAGGVRELGGLVARLLEEPVALRLCLLQLARGVCVRLREQLARLVTRRVQQLAALALALLAVALEVALALLQVGLAAAHFLLGL